MKAIKTVYHGPTNTRGARIYASAEGGNRASIPYPHECNQAGAHAMAAEALATKMRWTGVWVGGGFADCYVWVIADNDYSPTFTIAKREASKV